MSLRDIRVGDRGQRTEEERAILLRRSSALILRFSAVKQNGYVLLPVMLALTIVATVAFMLNQHTVNNLAMLDNEREAVQAGYTAQAGMQHALWHAARQGCGPYTDLTDVPLGEHVYSTKLTTDLGETNSYSVSVDQDGWIRDDLGATAHPVDSTLHFRSDGITERPVYRYDLSTIPAQTPIISAVAYFYVSKEHPQGPIDIHALDTDWTEDTANWELLGEAMDAKIQATIPAQPVAGVWVSVNLTPLVQAWVNGQSNFGITLNSLGDGAHGDYASRESMFAPYLDVVSGTPPSPLADEVVSTGTLASGLSRSVRRRQAVPLTQHPGNYLLLQPDDVGGLDAFAYEWNSTWNYGRAAEIFVSNYYNDSRANGLLKFNLGRLPFGARIKTAMLRLYQYAPSSNGGEVGVHRVRREWDEGEKAGGTGAGATWVVANSSENWSSGGSDYDTGSVFTQTIPVGTRGFFEWDITSLVQGWVSGQYQNHGLALVPAAPKTDVYFRSSDSTTVGERPSLEVTYSCTCGTACVPPQGAGNVLMVVVDPSTLVEADQKASDLFESWGYTVSFVSESANQATYDALTAVSDVVFISETVNSNQVGSKLVNASIGVVSQDGDYNADLGLATGAAQKVGRSVDIVETDHYITRPFASGALPVYAADMEQLIVSSAPTGGQRVLAKIGGDGSLVALDKGEVMEGGGNAAGRRVMLPLGTRYRFDWDYLNANGRLIVQRAIDWAMGKDSNSGDYYLDEFPDFTCDGADEYFGSSGSLDWSGFAWTEIGDDDRACGADFRVVDDPDIDDPTGNRLRLKNQQRSIIRQADLSGFSAAELSFDYRRRYTSGAAQFQVMVSGDGGSTWTMLDSIGAGNDSAYQSARYDISTFAAENTVIGFSVNSDFSGEAYIDNVRIDSTVSQSLLPIAHWKLDETSGTTAFDSEGGHHGALTNGPAWASGQFDGGLTFDGADDYVDLTADTELDDVFNGGATVMAWVYLHGWGGGAYGRVLDKSSAVSNNRDGWMIGTDGGSQSIAFVQGFSVARGFWRPQNNSVNLNEWLHYAIVYDASSDANDPVIYLNGVEQTSLVKIAPSGTIRSDASIGLRMGNYAQDTSRALEGRLDDVRIYGRMLSAGEIAVLATPPPKLPIAHWKLDETGGTTAIDSAGGHDGTLKNDPTWTPGQVDGALDFDGIDDHITVPHDPKLNLSDEFTITTWFRADSFGGTWDPYRTFLGKYPNSSTANYWFGTWTDELAFGFYAGGSFHAVYSSGLGLQPGRWYHAAVLFTDAGNAAKLYINGVGISKAAITASPPPNTGIVEIGQSIEGERWDGQLDDIRIYDQILTDAEIAALAVVGGGGGPPSTPFSCSGTYRDAFDNDQSFAGSSGSIDWSGAPWVEVGESDGPGAGDVRVTNDISDFQVHIRDNDNGGEGIERTVDLTDATAASLSYEYRRQGLDSTGDYAVVQVRASPSDPWTELARHRGSATDGAYQAATHDISGHIAPTTQIRLITSPSMGVMDMVWFDNVQVECSP